MRHSKFGLQPVSVRMFEEGLTLAEVAEAVDCSVWRLGHVARGDTRPSPDVLEALCAMFEVEPHELFTADVLAKPYRPIARAS